MRRVVSSALRKPTPSTAGRDAAFMSGGKIQLSPSFRFAAPESPDFCAARGHHGPFCNQDRYDRCPGWEGMAECVVCGGTVRAVTAPRLA